MPKSHDHIKFIGGNPRDDQKVRAIELASSLGIKQGQGEKFCDFWIRVGIRQPTDHFSAKKGDTHSYQNAHTRHGKIYFSSSGSSGTPKYTLLNFEEMLANSKIHGRGYGACGIGQDDIVATWGLPGVMNSEFTVYLALAETGCTILPIGDSYDPEKLYNIITKFQATVLLVMPSDFNPLVSYMESAGKSLPTVRLVVTGGEPLFLADKGRYAKALTSNVKFRSVFQTSDTGTLGYQCEHCEDGEYHIHSDLQLLELVNIDVNGIGDLVTTNLHRQLMPVVRQFTGDRASVVTSKCLCGQAVPKIRLCGRSGKIIKFGGEKFDLNWLLELKEDLGVPTTDFGVVAERDERGRDFFRIYSDKIRMDEGLQNRAKVKFIGISPKIKVQLDRSIVRDIEFLPMERVEGLGTSPTGKTRSFVDRRLDLN
jgi:hypothetical protein